MLVDDEYGPSAENAAHELGEVCRPVYGMSLAGSVEIQEGRCQSLKKRLGSGARHERTGR